MNRKQLREVIFMKNGVIKNNSKKMSFKDLIDIYIFSKPSDKIQEYITSKQIKKEK
tara:strand:+ start:537 stop:704 length:168 start_codon:yes stop_codon:yes gene_type:complete